MREIICQKCGKKIMATSNRQKFCFKCSVLNFEEIKKKWNETHKEQIAKQKRKYREQNREKLNAYNREWAKKHPERRREITRKSNRKLMKKRRLEALIHYGGNSPKCACCGEKHIEFLGIDHIGGNGNRHRRQIKRGSRSIYEWLYKNNFPNGYRVLCHNCNMSLGFYNYCPHQK